MCQQQRGNLKICEALRKIANHMEARKKIFIGKKLHRTKQNGTNAPKNNCDAANSETYLKTHYILWNKRTKSFDYYILEHLQK